MWGMRIVGSNSSVGGAAQLAQPRLVAIWRICCLPPADVRYVIRESVQRVRVAKDWSSQPGPSGFRFYGQEPEGPENCSESQIKFVNSEAKKTDGTVDRDVTLSTLNIRTFAMVLS